MAEWYYMSNGQQQGPVAPAQLKALASSGELKQDDLVWNASMPEWVPARRVKGLPFAGAAPAAAKPSAIPAASAAPAKAQASASSVASTPRAKVAADTFASKPIPVPSDDNGEEETPANTMPGGGQDTADEEPPPEEPNELAESIGKTQKWVVIVSFALLAGAGTCIALPIVQRFPELSQLQKKPLPKLLEDHALVIQAIQVIAGLFLLIPWLSLIGYGSSLSKVKGDGSTENVAKAINSQRAFFRNISIVLILLVILVVSYIVFTKFFSASIK